MVISIKDKAPYLAERFESGTLRRTYDKYYDKVVETNSVMWGKLFNIIINNNNNNINHKYIGMSTKIRTMDMSWSDGRSEITLSGGDIQTSVAPWHKDNIKDKNKR